MPASTDEIKDDHINIIIKHNGKLYTTRIAIDQYYSEEHTISLLASIPVCVSQLIKLSNHTHE